jgi:flagellar basal body-associated protein FliL
MKRRKGIVFITVAIILIIFATLTVVFIYNLSKDIYKSQNQAIKAKTLQYAKIAIVSMKNWVDTTKPTKGSTDVNSDDLATPVINTFFLDIRTPDTLATQGFPPSLESLRIDNTVKIAIYEATETTDAATTSLYALIDSIQTNLLAPQQDKTIYVYNEQGNNFEEPSESFSVYAGSDYKESVIYKFQR